MPMFHDPERPSDDGKKSLNGSESITLEHRTSEESIRTEFCEGPIPDDPKPPSPENEAKNETISVQVETSDRAELIERLKRGESPTWVPNRKLEEYYNLPRRTSKPSLIRKAINGSPLLPAIDLGVDSPSLEDQNPAKNRKSAELSPQSEIERPGSALHAGNFTESEMNVVQEPRLFQKPSLTHHVTIGGPLGTSPTTPWYMPPSRFQEAFASVPQSPPVHGDPISTIEWPARSRAPSLQSFSSSYVLKPPTSPLVQQSNNDDLDFSPITLSESPNKFNRRHTLPPQSSHSPKPTPNRNESNRLSVGLPSLRTDDGSPFQIHNPRRSLTSNWSFQASSSPQTPAYLRSRRPSFSSEASPLQHASMVGSYEESILRGRMSTGPSKPLDFTAQIGVFGKGNHKPKFPPHVTIPFPAVYYSWSNGAARSTLVNDDEPSPYVGHIDLEHSLPPVAEKESQRRYRGKPRLDDADASADMDSNHEFDCATMNLALRNREKQKRRSLSPKAPVGGSYRIPQQGQLQIMIKNPNKTAVKLFLVPYDLSNMEGGTKTFIRQRSYSAGPIIETPLTSSAASATGRDALGTVADIKSRPTLRYLIHLNICCPTKGRFYLYQHVRVVFANRVPDNKEKLQNDIQLPEPRYSTYKASRDSLPATSSAGTKLTAEKAQRRRSYGFGIPLGIPSFDNAPGLNERILGGGSSYPINISAIAPPVPPIPFGLRRTRNEPKAEDLGAQYDPMELDSSRPTTSSGLQSPLSDKTSRIANTLSSSYRSSASGGSEGYSKLNKGDAGYGGVFGRPGTPEPGEGLLARRLRGLGMDKEAKSADDQLQ